MSDHRACGQRGIQVIVKYGIHTERIDHVCDRVPGHGSTQKRENIVHICNCGVRFKIIEHPVHQYTEEFVLVP